MKHVSGNVLFLILLAVALFAALSYAVTQSNRSGGNNISDEDAQLAASRMVQYGALLRQSLMRLKLAHSIKNHEFDFRYENIMCNGTTAELYLNSSCTGGACRVFDVSGGGVVYQEFTALSSEGCGLTGWNASWAVPGQLQFVVAQGINLGSAENEIWVRIPGVDENICEKFNSKLGLPASPTYNVAGDSWVGLDTNFAPYLTSLNNTDAYKFGDNDVDLIGQDMFCERGVDHGSIWIALVER